MKLSIIGAGIGGLTTAIAIKKFNPEIEIEIFESNKILTAAGAGLALAANAMEAFKIIGIESKILEKAQIIDGFQILNKKGKIITQTNNLQVNIDLNTVSNFSIHRADLQEILLNELNRVKVNYNKKVSTFIQNNDSVEIHFLDGSSHKSDCVIAADGIHSVFRKNLVPYSSIRFAGYTCWRAVIENNGLPIKKSFATETWADGKRFGIVPLRNNKIYWFACINSPQMKDESFASFKIRNLDFAFKGFHNPISEIIKNTKNEQLIWNDIIDFKPIQKFAFNNVLLLGDSGHATTPNMGQGACQAIESAVVIAKLLALEKNYQSAFIEFEKRRIKRTSFIVNRSFQIGKISQIQNPIISSIRNFVFSLIPESSNKKQIEQILKTDFNF